MGKAHVHLGIDNTLLERAKLNKINLSKEFEAHLERLLAIETFETPNEIDKVEKALIEEEVKATETLKKLNDLKLKKQQLEKEQQQQLDNVVWRGTLK